MDKLAERLKVDAAGIEVEISDELDRRLTASFQGIDPVQTAPREPLQRPAFFWWASSLTGVAAALIVIAVINAFSQPVQPPATIAKTSPVNEPMTPVIDWKTESAMLTAPLQQELDDLQSDLRKAEEKVKSEIGL